MKSGYVKSSARALGVGVLLSVLSACGGGGGGGSGVSPPPTTAPPSALSYPTAGGIASRICVTRPLPIQVSKFATPDSS